MSTKNEFYCVEHCIHYSACLWNGEYIPTPCRHFKDKADVVEVRHGHWIEKDDGWDGLLYTCSVCHCDWTTIDGTPFENNMRYCPECGAKMDGERREE